jgi:ComF family protein
MTNLTSRALDVVLPPKCLACDALVDQMHTLCAACWTTMTFINAPHCARCGLPFETDVGAGAICGACAATPPSYQRARSAVVYDDASRRLILSFKRGDRTDLSVAFGQWMARAGEELLADADALVPVPLHWTRLFSRRYNQAALLADAVSRQSSVPVAMDALRRPRRTDFMAHKSAGARAKNVQGAIDVKPARRAWVQDKALVIVDDVLTTGATANACVRALRRAGARRVDVLSLARAVRQT